MIHISDKINKCDNVAPMMDSKPVNLKVIRNYLEQCECCKSQKDRVGVFTNLAALYDYLIQYPGFLQRYHKLLGAVQTKALEIEIYVSALIADDIINFEAGALLVQNANIILSLTPNEEEDNEEDDD